MKTDVNKIVVRMEGRLWTLTDTTVSKEMVDQLTSAFSRMSETQQDVSLGIPGCIPTQGEVPSRDAVRTYILAMIVELTELLQQLDWKPWKSKPALNSLKIIDEFADILAFQGIIIHYLSCHGIYPHDLAEGYRIKSKVNIERFLGIHEPEYKQQHLFNEGDKE